MGARLVLGDSNFQRQFIRIAMQKDGKMNKGNINLNTLSAELHFKLSVYLFVYCDFP